MSSTRFRFAVIGAIAASLVGLITLTVISRNRLLATLVPLCIAVCLVLIVYHGYFLARFYRWLQRQEEEQAALAKLGIPRNIRRPEEFEGVDVIDRLQKRVLGNVPDHQGRYRAVGLAVGFAPPFALLFLSIQVVFFPHESSWGAGFVFGEALLLGGLIFLVWRARNPTLNWIQARLRAELLRREQYLRLAGVGPYLGLVGKDADQTARMRLERIEKDGFPHLWQLVPLVVMDETSAGERFWLDDTWKQTGNLVRLNQPVERMQCYLYYRLGKQIMWFGLGTGLNERIEHWITLALRVALAMAFVAAATHGFLLARGISPELEQESPTSLGTLLLAFFLPPVGAALLGTQSLFAFRTLSWSYHHSRQELGRFKANLQRLLDSFSVTGDEREHCLRQIEFQALVLHSETEITHEMQRWLMLVHRPEFEAAP